jgi:hypothetical protein
MESLEMNPIDGNSRTATSTGPKILLTDTNRWPIISRMVIRLRNMGCTTAVLCPLPRHPVQKVRDAHQIFRYSGLAPVASLRRAIEAFDPDLIIPCCDRGVQHLHDLHAIAKAQRATEGNIAALIERSLGSPEHFAVTSSRPDLIEAARAEGIVVPKTVKISNDTDLQRWSTRSPLPWVIKADGTWGGRGVRIVDNGDEARRWVSEFSHRAGFIKLIQKLILNRDRGWALRDWIHSRRSVIAQSFVDGRPANCAVVCWKGNVLAGIAVEVIKSCGATGPATLVQVVPGVEMIGAAKTIARRLGISGFFGLDFIIENGTGSIYLIEMNPRCTPPCPLPLGEGRDLVAAFWAQLTGETFPSNQQQIEQSVVAYFPQAVGCGEVIKDETEDNSVHHDIPEGEPELVEELLRSYSARSIVGKLIDGIRPKSNQESQSIFLSIDEVRKRVANESTAETQV